MKKTTILVLIMMFLLLIIGCSSQIPAQDTPSFEKEELPLKEQAKNFGIDVVKTYFNKDCDTFFDALDNKIYTLEDDPPITKDENLKKQLCDSLKNAVKGDHTFEEYLDSYEVKVLDKTEYEKEFPVFSSLKNFKPAENDFLFVGATPKKPVNFMWDDLLIFMVRKEGKDFKIVVLGS